MHNYAYVWITLYSLFILKNMSCCFSKIITNRSKQSGLLVLVFFFIVAPFYGQDNLVFNGDFEDYSSCPASFSVPSENGYEIEKCIGWGPATWATSDYLNVCGGLDVRIPENYFGKQKPFSGNGYLGGYFAYYTNDTVTDGMWWEYIQGRFKSPLEHNKTYLISMEVSLADNSELMISELGIYFSDSSFSLPTSSALNFIPQCVFYNPDYYSDTLNWVHLETFYTSSGGEKYLTIGNFRNNMTTDTLRRKNSSKTGSGSYFYIDNVAAFDISDLDPPNIFTPDSDGLNDLWYPVRFELDQVFPNWTCEIFNRWGNSLYRFRESEPGWNGMDQEGKEVADGVYYYKVYYSHGVKSGSIQLVR